MFDFESLDSFESNSLQLYNKFTFCYESSLRQIQLCRLDLHLLVIHL